MQVHHVERAGLGIDQADANQQEGGADRAHDEVLVGGSQCPAALAEADQRVGRQRRYLQEHEQVEDVTGLADTEQPVHAQQEGGVEQ